MRYKALKTRAGNWMVFDNKNGTFARTPTTTHVGTVTFKPFVGTKDEAESKARLWNEAYDRGIF